VNEKFILTPYSREFYIDLKSFLLGPCNNTHSKNFINDILPPKSNHISKMNWWHYMAKGMAFLE